MNTLKKIARYFAQKNFCRTAIQQRADLSIFQEKPTLNIIIGFILIVFSYVIGIPSVLFLATVAIWLRKPLIGIIGGPLIYGISVLLLIIGIKLAGEKHLKPICAWLARIMLEKILGEEIKETVCIPQEASEIGNAEN